MTPRYQIALDLGGKTGWAIARDGELLESGVQEFRLTRGESPGMRFLRFRMWLSDLLFEPLISEGASLLSKLPISWVCYEAPHHRGGWATDLAIGFATRVQEVCAVEGVEHADVHTGTLKLATTGKGNASKKEMIEAARERWGIDPIDDNHADALCVLAWALKEYGP